MERMPGKDGGRKWYDRLTSHDTPRVAGCSPKLGKKHGPTLPQNPLRELTLPIPWFWTSSFQNSKKISFCCFKSPGLYLCLFFVWFFMPALGDIHSCLSWDNTSAALILIVTENSRSQTLVYVPWSHWLSVPWFLNFTINRIFKDGYWALPPFWYSWTAEYFLFESSTLKPCICWKVSG